MNAVKLTKRDLNEELTQSQMNRPYDSPHSFGKTYGEHRAFLELNDEQHFEVYKHAKSKGLDFVETLCSKGCLSLLKLFTPDYLKVASRDLTNLPLLEVMAETKIPMILSTGMAGKKELDDALLMITKYHQNVSILHCVSQYPTEPKNTNLNSIKYLQSNYSNYKIGYSDHTIGIATPVAAVAMGAKIIEKHIHQFVSRAHSIDLYHQKWGIINKEVMVPPFKLFKTKHTSKIISVSKHGENFLKYRFPAFKDKFATSYLGVTNLIDNTKKDNGFFHIVTCSGIDSNKRVTKLAEALHFTKANIKWTHFGVGPLLQELKKIISMFPQNINVDIQGSVPNVEIKNFYANEQVNLFINLSIVEGLPVSIMEAMSFGIPILATNIYGTPEAVIDNENGFLINVNFTVEQLVKKIDFCYENASLLKKMGKKSKEIYLEKFSAEKNYTEFANYLAST